MGRTSHTWYGPPQRQKPTPRRGKGRAKRPDAPVRRAPDPTIGEPHEWRIEIPGYEKPPLSLNYRMHRMQEYRIAQQLKEIVVWQATALRIPRQDKPVSVQLVWEVPDRRHRDGDNPIATTKPLTDGLVAAGVLAHDDDHRHVSTLPTRIDTTGHRRIALLLHGIR